MSEPARNGEKQRTDAGEVVRSFYDEFGWKEGGEDRLFRAFPPGHDDYAARAERRTEAAFDNLDGRLLIVGCGDMPPHHVRIAERFAHLTCMDISERALEIARTAVPREPELCHESVVETDHPGERYDAVLCSHVVYHIGAQDQEKAVRQMIRLVRPGGRIVVLYANPNSAFALPGETARALKAAIGAKRSLAPRGTPELYYHAHPRRWWRRFEDECRVSIAPWEAIGSRPARALLPGRTLPRTFYKAAGWFEDHFPAVSSRLWQYNIIILDKRAPRPA
jgi:SAM-dependent methyltransferase